MSRHHKGKFGNKINPWDFNSQQLAPEQFLANQSLEEKLKGTNMPISSQPNHQPNHDAANTYEAESVTAPEHNPMYHVLHSAQEYLLRGIDGLVSIITKPLTYKPLQKATLITTASLTLGGGSAVAYFHIPENPSQENRIVITKPQDYEINGKRLVFGNEQDNFSPYNSQANKPYKHEAGAKPKNPKENYNLQTGKFIASLPIALQPAPKSAYPAQTGDNSTGAVTGDGSNPPIEFPCMPPEVLGNAPFPPPGVSICETTDITTLAAKLFSTGDVVLTGDVNLDGKVGIPDLQYIARNLNRNPFPSKADLHQDGVIDIRDLSIVAINFGKSAPPNPCIDVPAIGFALNNDVIYSPAPAYTGDVKTIFDRAYCGSTGYIVGHMGSSIVFQDRPDLPEGQYIGTTKTALINRTNFNVGTALGLIAKEYLGGFHAFEVDRPLPEGTLSSTPWAEGRGKAYETEFMQYLQETYNLNMKLADTEENRRLLAFMPQTWLGGSPTPSSQGRRYLWAYMYNTPEWKAELDGPNAELSVATLGQVKNYLNKVSPMDFGFPYNQAVADWVSSVFVRRVSPDSSLTWAQGLPSLDLP